MNQTDELTLVKVSELFDIRPGHSLEYNRLTEDLEQGINFVSRTSQNNGISGRVILPADSKAVPTTIDHPVITVALGGSVLSTFLQVEPVVCGRDVHILLPKKSMSIEKMLFFCTAIEANKWRYHYGRQANRTLKDILIPSKMPQDWKGSLSKFDFSDAKSASSDVVEIDHNTWHDFKVSDLFDTERGNYKLPSSEQTSGKIPLVTASAFNNGVTNRVSHLKKKNESLYSANSLTIANNGSVGATFVQPEDFAANGDVHILSPKIDYSKAVRYFIAAVLEHQVSNRFHYGFKISLPRLRSLSIPLPSLLTEGSPTIDNDWIESFISGQQWSSVSDKEETKIAV